MPALDLALGLWMHGAPDVAHPLGLDLALQLPGM